MTTNCPADFPLRLLSVHLAHADPAWISLLEAEGVAWHSGPDASLSDRSGVVLTVPQNTPSSVVRECRELVSSGSTAICESGVWPGDHLQRVRTWRMPYETNFFCGLRDENDSRAMQVVQGSWGRGTIICLPFQLQPLWTNQRRARRFVTVGDGHVIHEDMATVVKKNVRRVIVDVLKQAFFRQDLPFAHKWYFPGNNRSVLCFRGDADGGPRENLACWLDAVRPFASATSLFFCTSQYLHKRDLIARAAVDGLEVGSHNHWHIVFPDRMTNRISLARAEKVLSSACYRPSGFVAPAYFWHASLPRLLEERGYQYSSCFGVNHDNIPYFPVLDGQVSNVLEIPFHCLGDRFPRIDIPLESDVPKQFFQMLIAKKYAAGEPMHLYGHPDIAGRMGSTPQLVQFICETALSHSDVKAWQLGPYAAWWRQRTACRIECHYDQGSRRLSCLLDPETILPEDLMLRVELPDGHSYLADPRDCRPPGLPVEQMRPFAPLKLPGPGDVGEVIHKDDVPPPAGQWRKDVRRFVRAYRNAYLPWLTSQSVSRSQPAALVDPGGATFSVR